MRVITDHSLKSEKPRMKQTNLSRNSLKSLWLIIFAELSKFTVLLVETERIEKILPRFCLLSHYLTICLKNFVKNFPSFSQNHQV